MTKTFGATLIVAGTTIGAGMLALPMASQALGTFPALGWLTGIAALMYYAGLVHIEINLFYGRQASSLGELASRSLGPVAGLLTGLMTGVLFYALLAAYSVGGASLFQGILSQTFGIHLSHSLLTGVFVAVLALITASRMEWLDYANRILFFIKMAIFAGLMVRCMPFVHTSLWGQQGGDGTGSLNLGSLAIFCTSFGFHISIPKLLPYLNYQVRSLHWAFLGGILASLGLYVLWTVTALGIIPPTGSWSFETIQASHNDLSTFLGSLNHWTQFPSLALMANGFSLLAILTSFLGVGAGLLSFLQERVDKGFQSAPSWKRQGLSVLFTYGIPLGFGLFYPQGFIMALEYAGIAAAFLSVTMPMAVGLKQRFSGADRGAVRLYSTPGGVRGMALALLLSIGIIALEFLK